MNEVRRRVERDERVLVTTLTKRMAEDLTDYLVENGFKVRYLHSEVDTLERIEIIRELRLGEFDVLVGINLLREGLDLPEVTLVAILDADKEGFLRGADESRADDRPRGAQRQRPGHHVRRQDDQGDGLRHRRDEPSPREAGRLQRGARHRAAQHRQVGHRHRLMMSNAAAVPTAGRGAAKAVVKKLVMPRAEIEKLMANLEAEMFTAADQLKFEYAAKLRDEIRELGRELVRRGEAAG